VPEKYCPGDEWESAFVLVSAGW